MLRRHSIKSKSDLQRRKSTSSARGVHLEHLDPELAQRDAHIAACQAFTRAQDRAAAEMPLFPPTPDSSPRRRQANQDTDLGSDEHNGIRRRQSVRFVGPCSVQEKLGQSGEQHIEQHSQDCDNQDPFRDVTDRPSSSGNPKTRERASENTPALLWPPPKHPVGDLPPVALPGIAAGYIDALVAGEEVYTPEDDIASAPSSYRRLRGSRSRSTRNGVHFTNSREAPRFSFDEEGDDSQLIRESSVGDKTPKSAPKDVTGSTTAIPLRTPKSMSFLKHRQRKIHIKADRTSHESSNQDTADQPGATNSHFKPLVTARSTPQLRSQTSTLFSSKSRRPETRMRKSLRSGSSMDGFGSPEANGGVHSSGDDRLKNKARKASKSLKTRLKSLFTISRSEESPPSIPAQHIESQRYHTSEDSGLPFVVEPVGPGLDWGSVHQVPSRLPSVQMVPGNLVHSNKGSLESLRSERERKVSEDKSFTSWTNSGPSTLTSQQQQQWKNEWERQRLSVIGGNGAHAPSSSLKRQPLGNHLFAHPGVPFAPVNAQVCVTNSDRIYSALMKRAQAISDKHNKMVELRQHGSNSQSDSHDCYNMLGVHNGGPINTDICSFDTLNTPTRVSRNATPFDDGVKADIRSGILRHSNSGYAASETQRSVDVEFSEAESNLIPGSTAPDPFTSNMKQVSTITEDLRTFSNRNSAFFGSPNSHLFRTTSPYRRALRKSMEEEENRMKQNPHESGDQCSESGTQIHNSDKVPLTGDGSGYVDDGDYSESVYSTDECEPAEDEARPRRRRATKDFASLQTPLIYRPGGYRDDSSDSSVDWKTWLSANVAKLDSSPTQSRAAEIEVVLPTMPKNFSGGHFRESAQIHEDYDEDTDAHKLPTHMPSLPTTPLATVETNVVKVSPRQRSIKQLTPVGHRSLLDENDSPSDAPPIPPKSVLRAVPSPLKWAGSNVGHGIPPSISSSPGLSAAVQRQFGPVAKSMAVGYDTPDGEGAEGRINERRHGRSYRQRMVSGEEGNAFI